MIVIFDSTGIKASFSEEDKAMRFVSRGAAVQVSHALLNAYGQFYPVEMDRWEKIFWGRKMKLKKLIAAVFMTMTLIGLVACRESKKVSHNISQEADNFNVVRRVAVINTRTDMV